jgi:tetratricopeptide (TPR) repeat protein
MLSIVVIAISCQPKVSPKEQLLSRIDTLEFQINGSEVELLDDRKPNEVVSLYKNFAQEYPNDTLAPIFLFKAAEVEVGLGKSLQAIHSLDSLIIKYPSAENTPSALQFKAFIWDTRLGNINKAAEALDYLIENYPESDLIKNSKEYKATLGKSPEEIILEMQNKSKEQQDSIS